MSIRGLARRATPVGAAITGGVPLYVDSDDNRVKVIPTGTGTTEVILTDAGGAASATVLTAARTLTAADSGKVFFLALAAGFAVALPAPAVGLNFSFYVQIAPTPTDYTIVSPTAVLGGQVHGSNGGNGGSVTAFTATTITFVGAASAIGDSADVWSDGTNWYAQVHVDLGATGATIS